MEKIKKVDKVVYEIVGFEPISTPTAKHVVTTGSHKGWIINTTLVLKKVVYEGQNDDGTPKFKLGYEVVSTPTPPEK
jgi:hypothetical protein